MALEEYKKKRDFTKTPEPGPQPASSDSGNTFVIQKHAATRLHYDFRLELDGVLLSWAVPKGPSLDPNEKRLAVHVEDHPLEYQDFEGVIPKGEYGGGSVLVWDRGNWIPEKDKDVHEAYKKGRLSFTLQGDKLHGAFSLFRVRGRPGDKGDNWLLVKKKDEHAKPTAEGDITADRPESVVTGRTMEEVAAQKDRTWRSDRSKNATKQELTIPEEAKTAAMPAELSPELATLVEEAPEGKNWIYEIKLDGYRTLAFIKGGEVHLISRTGKDWSQPLEPLASACLDLGVKTAILDGEVVAFADNGVTSFQRLQTSFGDGRVNELSYFFFDLLYLDGRDLRELPLIERKKLLQKLMSSLPKKHKLRYSEHFNGPGKKVFEQACALGLEGIIAKKKDAAYQSKRTKDWVKIKCSKREVLLIGGYTDPEGSRTGIGALLMGKRDEESGELAYAGKVGTGFDQATLEMLAAKLSKLEIKSSPFDRGAPSKKKGVHWVEPKLSAEIEFIEWTNDGVLRHPSFQGLAEGTVKTGKSMPAARAETTVKITNPDRVLWDDDPQITKRQLVEYYQTIGDWMLPHVKERPLMLVRAPEGYKKGLFHQKHQMKGTHASIKHVEIDEGGETKNTLYVDSVDGLVALAQMSGLEIHTWGAHIDDIEKPDLYVFDLDPDESLPFARVCEGAIAVRDLLKELRLKSFVKTTGGKGLHVVAPVERTLNWEKGKIFAEFVANEMVRRDPKKYLATMTKSKRAGKIFVDYFRNGRGATFVAPYSTRARKGATIAMPVLWEELEELKRPDQFNLLNVEERIRAIGKDPWAELATLKQKVQLPSGTQAA